MGLLIDNFAGGGGASTGIEIALGRCVDIAINHDPEAIDMHRRNHPHTRHYVEDVWEVDPHEITGGQHVDLLWLSPDCKHFSRAKGGKPVEKRIRGLSWVALKYAGTVRPDVIMLENVPEIMTWGPLVARRDPKTGRVLKVVSRADGKPCTVLAAPGEVVQLERQELIPDRKRAGRTFRRFVQCLRNLGYVVEWRELKACDYDAPTIRSRLFLIARCDGLPIVWPEATHGPGRPQPYRTAAECIDWSIPCPSIFDRKKPLAEATNRRIAKGIMRFVVENPNPFIVSLNHTASYYQHFRGQEIDTPAGTITQCPGFALVSPHVTKFRANSVGHPVDEPLHTITACSVGEAKHPGGAAPLGVVSANLLTYYGDKNKETGDFRGGDVDAPIATQTTENRHALVAASLVKQNFGEKPCQDADEPLHTVTTQGNKFQLVEAFLAKHYTGVTGSDLREPLGTATAVDHHSLVAASIARQFGKSVGSACDDPVGTITAGGDGKTLLQASTITRLKGTCQHGQDVREPLRTINAQGTHFAQAQSFLMKLQQNSVGQNLEEPFHTVMPGATRFAEVRAFLMKYYSTNVGQNADEPMHTVTAKDRIGLVTVAGEEYAIVDIGMRMLQPRELYRAQGFPDSYVIDFERNGKKLSKSAQVRMVGNSVCPPVAAALVKANLVDIVKEAAA